MNLSAIESGLQLREEKIKKLFQTLTALVDDSCRELGQVACNMIPPADQKQFLRSHRGFVNKLDKSTLANCISYRRLGQQNGPQTRNHVVPDHPGMREQCCAPRSSYLLDISSSAIRMASAPRSGQWKRLRYERFPVQEGIGIGIFSPGSNFCGVPWV